ncbi:ABC transporter ATP-binding protein [Robbsia sp. KACC 23696]|uniref:ABC transporter ATP-binding protein n=1 Tax=Robbsia sp. KACC 23696 TaxID=3149231 RepID=UPI00325A674F
MSALLQIDGLHLERDGVALLRDVTLTLNPGRTLGLVGESGAGKSMLGRVLGRLIPPQFETKARTLTFAGENLLSMPAAAHRALLGRRIAYIPQEPTTALDPTLSIGKQFALHLGQLGVPSGARRQRALDALTEVLLPDPEILLTRFPFELSGGMCQRVAIAMAFASNPELVISDEATTALDVTTQRHVVDLMRAMQAKRGTGILFVTHDLGLARFACDDIAVLYAGDIVERGTAQQVVNHPSHPYTQALLRANPPLKGPAVRVVPLGGHMPGFESFATIAGCRFASRCPRVEDACRIAPVPMIDTGASMSRCLRPVIAANAGTTRPLSSDGDRIERRPMGPFLQLRGVSKRYTAVGAAPKDGSVAPLALAPLDLDIAPGEFIGIVGESGSGKSTLGRLVMGLDTLSSGTIQLDDQVLGAGRAEWQRRIGAIQMIFQDARAALNPRRRLGDIVTQPLAQRAHLHVDRERRALALLEEVGLAPELADRYPAQLSGGQRQRVNIARALCDVPRLIVADEIVSGLDVSVQAQIMELLLSLRASHNVALLLISHDLAVVRYLCSRVIVLQRGVVVEQGRTEDVLRNPQHPYTRTLLASAPHVERPGETAPVPSPSFA